ncbi:MAG: aromatic acid exporter family protein [Thermoleophilia bacterium]
MTGLRESLTRRARDVVAAVPVEGPYIVRILVVAAVSWQVCVWLGADNPPVYAVIVPLMTIRDEPGSAFNLSIGRLVGVVAGLGIGLLVLAVLEPGLGALALVMAIALAVGIVARVGGSMNVQVALSALLVFANAAPDSFAFDRLWETLVGAVVTVALAPVLLPTDPAKAMQRRRARAAEACRDALLAARGLLGDGGDDRGRAEAAAREADAAAQELPVRLADARTAVRMRPLWRRRHPGGLEAFDEVAEAAPDVAALIVVHVADVLEMRDRDDAREWWGTAAPHVREILPPLAEATAARLAGAPAAAPLAAAGAAIDRFSAADGSMLGAIVRRPLKRILAILEGLGGD